MRIGQSTILHTETSHIKTELRTLRQQLLKLRNEVNYRRERGNEGAEHLRYVEDELTKLID